MSAPSTNGQRILLYGRDSTLQLTRRMVLASSGFDVDSVSTYSELKRFIENAEPQYELLILCHTVPLEEREKIRVLAARESVGLYLLQRMQPPPRLVREVAGIIYDGPAISDRSRISDRSGSANMLSRG